MNLKYYYWYYKEVLPKWFCNALIKDTIENKKIDTGLISPSNKGLKNLKIRDSNICFLKDQWLSNILDFYLKDANKRAGWNFDINNSEDCQFTVYNKSQHYDWHQDQDVEPYKEGVYKNLTRKLSMSVSLNDAKEYEGGQFKFFYGKENVCEEIKTSGSLIIFPSFINHKVEPVIKGTRYSLVKWYLGKNFK